MTKVLVTGAGGFIGHHLVSYLKSFGYWVRGVDLKYPEYGVTDADEFSSPGPSPVGKLSSSDKGRGGSLCSGG